MAAELPFFALDEQKFKDYLRFMFEKKFGLFNGLIYKYKALIAGGSLTNTFLDSLVNDLDIYINYEQAEGFMEDLIENFNIKIHSQIPCSAYDKAFLVKNGILLLYRGMIMNDAGGMISEFDVMVTKPKPIKVVTNFDLTACQIWYDGKDVKTTHLDILDKISYLNDDYLNELMAGNVYIMKRIQKYAQRGLTIKLPPLNIKANEEEEKYDVEKVVVKGLYYAAINYPNKLRFPHIMEDQSNLLSCYGMLKGYKFILLEYTLDEFIKVFKLHPDNKAVLPAAFLDMIKSAYDDRDLEKIEDFLIFKQVNDLFGKFEDVDAHGENIQFVTEWDE